MVRRLLRNWNKSIMRDLSLEEIHHEVQVVSCCDWKAAACIEGVVKHVDESNNVHF